MMIRETMKLSSIGNHSSSLPDRAVRPPSSRGRRSGGVDAFPRPVVDGNILRVGATGAGQHFHLLYLNLGRNELAAVFQSELEEGRVGPRANGPPRACPARA